MIGVIVEAEITINEEGEGYWYTAAYESDLTHRQDLIVEARATVAQEFWKDHRLPIQDLKIKKLSTWQDVKNAGDQDILSRLPM